MRWGSYWADVMGRASEVQQTPFPRCPRRVEARKWVLGRGDLASLFKDHGHHYCNGGHVIRRYDRLHSANISQLQFKCKWPSRRSEAQLSRETFALLRRMAS